MEAPEPGLCELIVVVVHHGRDPERGDAEAVEIRELGDQPVEVAAVIRGRILELDVEIVLAVAVGEAIEKHEVDDLVLPGIQRGGTAPLGVERGLGASRDAGSHPAADSGQAEGKSEGKAAQSSGHGHPPAGE
ncbi:hypothetical protein D3C72_1952420 [compost metagenome]